ncbi:MAG: serine/threonine protein kinase [Candidatus Riflebacteria bacterium]|nr:serine/threonine protein kinase [Candidatus Riflebacteria bacterium]
MRYKLLGELGKGGMGVVYRALHPELNREVAIKFLQGDVQTMGEVTVTRFQREMAVLIGLSHPGIIKVFDAGEHDGKLFYVMELVKGVDLLKIQISCGRVPQDKTLIILDQLLDALELVHSRGIVHRDIKPANIMIDEAGRTILMDFGVVRLSDATVLTEEGRAVGTPLYFSPQVIHGASAGPLDDLWSVGVVAYQMLSGLSPFEGKSIQELVCNIVRQEIPRLSDRCPDIPAEVDAFVHRFLEREPSNRWPGARQARLALEEIRDARQLSHSGGPPPRTSARRATARRIPRVTARMPVSRSAATGRSPFWGVALVAAVVLAAIGAGIGIWIGASDVPARGAPSKPENVMVGWRALDRLVVEFSTGSPGRWALRGPGIDQVEGQQASRHRFELAVQPFKPLDGLTLAPAEMPAGAGPDRRVDVTLPPSPADWVHRLGQAVRASRLTPERVDKAWVKVHMALIKRMRSYNGSDAAEMVRREPHLVAPLNDLAAETKAQVGKALDGVKPFVPALLMADGVPDGLLEELLRALARLDFLDGTTSYLGLPSVIGVHEILEPALKTSLQTALHPPGSGPGVVRAFPPPREAGIVLFREGELPSQGGGTLGALSSAVLAGRVALRDSVSVERFHFEASVPAASPGSRIHFKVTNMGTHGFLHLYPPGLKEPLPIRFPQGRHVNANQTVWLTVQLTGALAHRPGRWTGKSTHAFSTTERWVFVVNQVLVEPL